MVRHIAPAGIILGVALFIGAVWPVLAGGARSDSEVKVSATLSKADAGGNQTLTVTLMHNKGWHTYANPVGNMDFDSNKTVVSVQSKGKPLEVKLDYPVGKLNKDTTIGDYRIYENKTEIKGAVHRAQGDSGPLEVSVKIIACHDKGVCLLPATVRVTVP